MYDFVAAGDCVLFPVAYLVVTRHMGNGRLPDWVLESKLGL